MLEGAMYLMSSFWLGAVHAATPGHGKTVSAAYLVGTRGRPADAVALGIFVTLAHTSGITLFALLATLGSSNLSQRAESQLSLVMALLIVGIGVWMLASSWHGRAQGHTHGHAAGDEHSHFGVRHSHRPERLLDGAARPSWMLLLGLGLAGGLLPDPAALAVLLAAIAGGKLVLGLLTVLVFSLGFASVLVLVGTLVGRMGQSALGRIDVRWLDWLQVGTAAIIIAVGVAMTASAWNQLSNWL
jgi:nickel/cobalt transporter (NicO) family protein